MIAAVALALALGAGPAGAGVAPRQAAVAQEDWEEPYWDEYEDERPRWFLWGWGGTALDAGGAGRSSGVLGGEVARAFEVIDVGLAGYAYRDVSDDRKWTPVALVRVTQRFRTRGGAEAAFTLGVGAGRPDDWIAWYQLALGARVALGPLHLGGEIAFEQYDLLRLVAGLGVAF